MTIAAILDSISQHRFATYKSSVFRGASEEECLGIYLWNKQLAGAFLPALQIIEVSLRNAICAAKRQHEEKLIEQSMPAASWPALKGRIDDQWFVTVMTEQNNPDSWRAVKSAKNQLIKDGKPLTTENLISKLTFGFWVSMVNREYSAGRATFLNLWPHLIPEVFPNALDKKQGTALSINRIGADLRDINTLRNRLSHHEPLWRSDKTYCVEQAINKVVRDYHKCLDVIRWINPSNLKLLTIIENSQKMNELCNPHALWKNKKLPSGLPDIPPMSGDDWLASALLETRHTGEIISMDVAKGFAMILSEKDGTKFIARSQSFTGRINAYTLGDRVTFEPENKTTGRHPCANAIKPA
ncbi:Abi family protein [Pantoea stewartii]|uniref:Abi family protein n=1 Tax=Pantoea stewartii TaxID=66269 RepID=UPI001627B137|nr:Abi family protein [Pantoea stewartii]MBC0856456.1 Abi family protein [Pantoea stewartii]